MRYAPDDMSSQIGRFEDISKKWCSSGARPREWSSAKSQATWPSSAGSVIYFEVVWFRCSDALAIRVNLRVWRK